ncbi:MAG TPA: hypothetical protein VD884_17440 [Ohtaekwangia sp.]|nr:hypothetical protein [Ohtaekwangia sp.]
MSDFDLLKHTCEANSKLSAAVVDDFIMNYAAGKDGVGREVEAQLKKYRHVDLRFQSSLANMLKAQYIIHKVFKKGGLINKYINQAEIKRRPAEEQTFLHHQLNNPWRFSFSKIVGSPAQDFYKMEDMFTGERFLMYSKNISVTLKEASVMLWFNLIAYNGTCWQSYGPIIGYTSFDDDDIFFFGTELNNFITDDEDLVIDIEKNPVPYMLLLTGSRYPITMNKEDELVQCYAEHILEVELDVRKLSTAFRVEHNRGVYKLALNEWDNPPHFAVAYYQESQQEVSLHAMTDLGFKKLAGALVMNGIMIPEEPQLRVHPSMLATAGKILKKTVRIESFDSLFEKKKQSENSDVPDRMNALIGKILPEINSGRTPDLEKLSKEFDLEYDNVKTLVSHMMERVEVLRRGGKPK